MKLNWSVPANSTPGSRRVAITGLGVIAACGQGKDSFWQGLLEKPIDGERRIHNFDPSPWFGPKEARRADRFTQFAVGAAELALQDAGTLNYDPDRSGVMIGTGIGGIGTLEEQIVIHKEKGPRRVSPFLVPLIMANAASASVSMRKGWRGPCETTVTACASGTHSIGNAARLIASGRCDVMIAGGTEAAMTPVSIAGFTNMTALSSSGISMPFDARRDGFVMAEGAAIVVLEDFESAKARGAYIYAELSGAASTADAYHITAPSPGGNGASTCMELALEDAELDPSQIGHINAHGTSTPLNDAAEAEAIVKVFGNSAPPVTSIKGVTGHSLGAAGAMEAVAVALSIEKKLIPPTMGFSVPDPSINLDIVTQTRPWEPSAVLSNSFGFGGHNGCLVISPIK